MSDDDRDEFDRQAQAHWEKHCRRTSPITLKPLPMTGADRVDVERMAGKLRREANATQEERCGFSELPKSQCSHCRPAAARPPTTVDGKWRRFEARFPGKCVNCGKAFRAGDDIARTADREYLGPCCADEADPQ